VLPLLLARPEPERATHLARQVYLQSGLGVCVVRSALGAGLAVDHVIPLCPLGLQRLVESFARGANHQQPEIRQAANLRVDAARRPQIAVLEVLRDEASVAF
jgi:hypothetical protein